MFSQGVPVEVAVRLHAVAHCEDLDEREIFWVVDKRPPEILIVRIPKDDPLAGCVHFHVFAPIVLRERPLAYEIVKHKIREDRWDLFLFNCRRCDRDVRREAGKEDALRSPVAMMAFLVIDELGLTRPVTGFSRRELPPQARPLDAADETLSFGRGGDEPRELHLFTPLTKKRETPTARARARMR